jgi:Ca-activated chloride channel family protein
MIGDAIRKGVASLDTRANRDGVLLLITDGEDQDSFALDAARQAAERGIKIFTVGLGDTVEGARIPTRDEQGNLQYVQGDEGTEHWSKMDEKLLRDIALATGGAYIPAQTRAYDLGQIYDSHLAELTRGELGTERRKRYRERFQWFLAAGLACLALEMLLPAYARAPQSGFTRRDS